MVLNLDGQAGITDEGLGSLKGLVKLNNLYLRGTSITERGVQDLHKALPQCKIEWDRGTVGPDVASWTASAEQQAFLDQVAKLPAEKQLEAVRQKLQEVNPGFDGELQHKIGDGQVIQLRLITDHVTELWPIRACHNSRLCKRKAVRVLVGRGEMENSRTSPRWRECG